MVTVRGERQDCPSQRNDLDLAQLIRKRDHVQRPTKRIETILGDIGSDLWSW